MNRHPFAVTVVLLQKLVGLVSAQRHKDHLVLLDHLTATSGLPWRKMLPFHRGPVALRSSSINFS